MPASAGHPLRTAGAPHPPGDAAPAQMRALTSCREPANVFQSLTTYDSRIRWAGAMLGTASLPQKVENTTTTADVRCITSLKASAHATSIPSGRFDTPSAIAYPRSDIAKPPLATG